MEDHAVPVANKCRPHLPHIHFPFDLVYLFIDHARDDKPTLAACVLVSREWFRPAQAHLFRNISIRRRNKLRSFIEYLCSESNTIRDLVQGLDISTNVSAAYLEIDLPTLRTILFHLPAVTNLKLRFLSLVPTEDDMQTIADFESWIPRPMREVACDKVDFLLPEEHITRARGLTRAEAMFREVSRFLSLFSTVQEMYLGQPFDGDFPPSYEEWTSTGPTVDFPFLPHLQVQELIMASDANTFLVESVRRSGSTRSLETLQFSSHRAGEVDAVQALIYDSSALTHTLLSRLWRGLHPLEY